MLTELRSTRFVRRFVTPLVLLSTLWACHSWSQIGPGPRLPGHILVTPRGPDREVGGSRGTGDRLVQPCLEQFQVEVYSPVVIGDTIRGRAAKESTSADVAIAISDICRMEERRVDVLKTIATAVIVPMAVLGVVVCSSGGCGPSGWSGS